MSQNLTETGEFLRKNYLGQFLSRKICESIFCQNWELFAYLVKLKTFGNDDVIKISHVFSLYHGNLHGPDMT